MNMRLIVKCAAVALILMVLTLYSNYAQASEHLLHPGDISGHSAPVTIVCVDPEALVTILSQPTVEDATGAGRMLGKLGVCKALPGPVLVTLDKAVKSLILDKGVTNGLVVRGTVYRVSRQDGDVDAPVQYYVYILENLKEA